MSLSLTLGEEIDDEEFKFCLEELALDPWVRSLDWQRAPAAAAAPGLLGDDHRRRRWAA